MNLSEMRQRVLEHLRESTTSPVGVTNDEVNRYINDGYSEAAEITQAVVEELDLSVPARQNFVTLPDNSLAPLTFVDKATGFPIHQIHWTWLDDRDRRWIRRPRQRPSLIAAFGLHEFILYPHYTAAGTITMLHAIVPVDLASDTDVPLLPEQHHMGLVHYAIFRALVKNADGPRLGRALRQKQYYDQTVDGLGVWSVDRHETLHTAVYGVFKQAPSSIVEWG
jgi:hypothetical protein